MPDPAHPAERTPAAMAGLCVVGIPARNEAATVAAVATAADGGLTELAGDGLVVLTENGSTDGTIDAFCAAELAHRREVISTGADGTGKGTNVLALIHRAVELDAKALVLLDGDLRSAAPWWVSALAGAVDVDAPTLATPVYQRDRFEAGTTNHLVTPLLAGLLGGGVQQPIGGDVALNAALLHEALTWPAPVSAEHYGIDVWLTAGALARHQLVVEVDLGTKLHSTPFPSVLQLPRQVLDTLLRTIMVTGVPDAHEVRIKRAARSSVRAGAGVPQPSRDVGRVLEVIRRYSAAHAGGIARHLPSLSAAPAAPWGRRIDSTLWPRVLGDAVDAIAAGAFDAGRDHLVAAYVQRLVTFWDEVRDLDAAGVDAVLAEQITATAAELAPRRRALRGAHAPSAMFQVAGPWTPPVDSAEH